MDGAGGGESEGARGRARGGRRIDGPALLVVPLLLAAVAHLPALGNGFTNWDDPLYLIENPLTTAPLADGVRGLLETRGLGYPVPVTVLGYAAQRAAFGLEPAGFHAVSLALHLIVVALAAWLARRLGARWIGAAAAAALFAVHPLVVEPVAWVVGQKDLLAAAWLLAALAIRAGARGDRAGPSAAVALCVLLAMAAKPSAVTAVLLIVGIDAVRGRAVRRPAALALYGVTAALGVAGAWLAVRGHHALGLASTERVGARSLELAAWALELQLEHVAWPAALTARYFPPDGGALHALAAVGAALAAALVALVVVAWRRGHRAVAFGVAGALIAYAPAGGIVPLARGPADSYLYLPLAIAVCAAAPGLGALLAGGALGRLRARALATAGAVAIALTVLIAVARVQTAMWRDSFALWTALATRYPEVPHALENVAGALVGRGEVAAGLAVYDDIERRFPAHAAIDVARGETLARLGRLAEADRALARGMVRLASREAREAYGFFLVNQPIAPADPALARDGMAAVAPLLAARGKRPPTVRRAAALCEQLGMTAEAAALRARLRLLESR